MSYVKHVGKGNQFPAQDGTEYSPGLVRLEMDGTGSVEVIS